MFENAFNIEILKGFNVLGGAGGGSIGSNVRTSQDIYNVQNTTSTNQNYQVIDAGAVKGLQAVALAGIASATASQNQALSAAQDIIGVAPQSDITKFIQPIAIVAGVIGVVMVAYFITKGD